MTIDNNLLADSYDAAADYIEQNGWFQGNLYETVANIRDVRNGVTTPRACAFGAAFAVGVMPVVGGQNLPRNKFSVFDIEVWAKPLEVEVNERFLPDWNDMHCNSAEELIDLFRMTALKLRTPTAGNIGDNPREYEFEPMPTTEPVHEPAAPQPVKDPQPA